MTCDFQRCGILTSVDSDEPGCTYNIDGNLWWRLKYCTKFVNYCGLNVNLQNTIFANFDDFFRNQKCSIFNMNYLLLVMIYVKSETLYNLLLRSAVGNVSGYRCASDCRSRGREFDPGQIPYFRGD